MFARLNRLRIAMQIVTMHLQTEELAVPRAARMRSPQAIRELLQHALGERFGSAAVNMERA